MKQPYVFIEEAASGWKEHDRLDVLLLRAICQLSIDNPEQIQDGFPPHAIVEGISRLLGRPWSDNEDKSQMSSDVRRTWNTLLKTWKSKEEGLIQQLEDAGHGLFPHLEKDEGGGAGRLSKYRIEWLGSDTAPQQDVVDTNSPFSPKSQSLRYICEDIEDAGILTRIFSDGYRLTGWRKWLIVLAQTV